MIIDLRSDTVTRPTPAMLQAMTNAQAAAIILADLDATPIERRGALIMLNLQTPQREQDDEIIQQHRGQS
jgi:hypothetical protein